MTDKEDPEYASSVADAAMSAHNVAHALEPMRRLVALHFEIERAEDGLKRLKAEAEELSDVCLARFLEVGTQSIPLVVDGTPVSVHVHTTLRTHKAKGVEMQAACDALRECGLDWLVREQYVAQTLGAYVKEQLAGGAKLPEIFDPANPARLFDVGEDRDVRVVRTSKQESQSARAARTLRAQRQGEPT